MTRTWLIHIFVSPLHMYSLWRGSLISIRRSSISVCRHIYSYLFVMSCTYLFVMSCTSEGHIYSTNRYVAISIRLYSSCLARRKAISIRQTDMSPYLFVSIRHVLHVSIRHVLHVGRPYLFDKQICRHIYSYLFVMSCTSEGHGSSDDVALSCRYVVTWLVHIYSSLIHICSSCLPTSIGRGSSDFVAHSYQYVVTWRIHIYYSLIHICSSCLQRR